MGASRSRRRRAGGRRRSRSTSAGRTPERTCERYPSLVEQDEVEPLVDADVDPERSHRLAGSPGAGGRGSRAGRSASARPSTWPALATSTAGPCSSSANADSTGSSHSTIGIGGAMTSATSAWSASGSRKIRSRSSRSRIEPTNCATSVGRLLAHDRGLRDPVRLQQVDRLSDLVVGAHRDQGRQLAALGRQHLARRGRSRDDRASRTGASRSRSRPSTGTGGRCRGAAPRSSCPRRSSRATWSAAKTALPQDPPTRMPS